MLVGMINRRDRRGVSRRGERLAVLVANVLAMVRDPVRQRLAGGGERDDQEGDGSEDTGHGRSAHDVMLVRSALESESATNP